MPRYYAEKIYKGVKPAHPFARRCSIKTRQETSLVMVETALSRALADRAQALRWEFHLQQLEQNKDDGYNGYKKSLLSETISLVQRDSEAKNSLVSFYRKSKF